MICQYCKTMIQDEARFCPYCGRQVVNKTAHQQQKPWEASGNGKKSSGIDIAKIAYVPPSYQEKTPLNPEQKKETPHPLKEVIPENKEKEKPKKEKQETYSKIVEKMRQNQEGKRWAKFAVSIVVVLLFALMAIRIIADNQYIEYNGKKLPKLSHEEKAMLNFDKEGFRFVSAYLENEYINQLKTAGLDCSWKKWMDVDANYEYRYITRNDQEFMKITAHVNPETGKIQYLKASSMPIEPSTSQMVADQRNAAKALMYVAYGEMEKERVNLIEKMVPLKIDDESYFWEVRLDGMVIRYKKTETSMEMEYYVEDGWTSSEEKQDETVPTTRRYSKNGFSFHYEQVPSLVQAQFEKDGIPYRIEEPVFPESNEALYYVYDGEDQVGFLYAYYNEHGKVTRLSIRDKDTANYAKDSMHRKATKAALYAAMGEIKQREWDAMRNMKFLDSDVGIVKLDAIQVAIVLDKNFYSVNLEPF